MSERIWRWDEATGYVYEDDGHSHDLKIARVESDAAADPIYGDGPVIAASLRLLKIAQRLVEARDTAESTVQMSTLADAIAEDARAIIKELDPR